MGAVKFDPFSSKIDIDNGLHIRVDVDTQIEMGRHAQPETIEWWGRQESSVQEEALGDEGRMSLDDFCAQLNRFVVGADAIWAQGPVFDITILENLYRQLEKPAPWDFWRIRDSRTLFGVHGDPREKGRKGAHNALMDCVSQAEGIQQIYKNLRIAKREYSSPNK
jgi:hypothetical protein